MHFLHTILNFFGHAVCHQLSGKTFSAFGMPICFCARCLGIYVGFFVVFSYFFGMRRWLLHKYGGKILPRIYYFISFGLIVLMPIDALLQAGNVYFSNVTRLITGLLFGFGMSHIIILLYGNVVGDKKYEKNLLETRSEFWGLFALIVVLFVAILTQNDFIVFGMSIVAVLGLLTVGIVVHVTLFALASELYLKKKLTRISFPLFLLAVGMVGSELYLLDYMHTVLLK